MKAAVLVACDQPLRVLDQIRIPALRPGQVLVQLAFSGVCRSQLMEARGWRGPDRFLPHLLGHEGTGRVVDCGPGVTMAAPGDAVVLTWIKAGGMDAGGVAYAWQGQTLNAGAVTTFNDYAVVSENRCVRLPPGMPMDTGVLLGCAIPTGAGMVMNEIRPEPGSVAAVFGLGGVGLSALMTFRLFACKTCIAVDVQPEKLELARALGADYAFNAAEEDVPGAIAAITEGRGVDYSVDATGRVEGIEQAFASVRLNGGLCVFASHPQYGGRITLDPFDLIRGRQIRGSWGGACDPRRDIPRFAALAAERRLPLERLISHRYPLEAINQALDDLEAGRIARALLEINPAVAADD